MELEPLQLIDWALLAVTIVLLALSATFSGAEIAILSANRFRVHQLAEDGDPRARLLQRLLEHPQRMLGVILILITALNYINESLATYWLHDLRGLPEWIPFVSLLVLVLIFAEVTPISYAAANPEAFATGVATLVNACTRVLQPLVAVFSAVAGVFVRALGGEPATRPVVTGEEVMTIVNLETERGVLEEEEKALIHSIFEFSDTIVREIMRPRIDVIAVADTGTVAEAVALIASHRISRLPVYQGSIDHTVGLVHAKDLLPYQIRRALTAPVRLAMRPATFVPETKRVSELLRELREAKQTLAIVLDEYGGTAGLVTVEDLLEEIVGEIYDEYDVEQALLERVDDRTVIVDGKFLMDELDDLFDHKFPDGEYDTVGGFIYHHFGDVPARGEQCTVDGYLFIVERLDGHRIAKVRVIAPAEEQAP